MGRKFKSEGGRASSPWPSFPPLRRPSPSKPRHGSPNPLSPPAPPSPRPRPSGSPSRRTSEGRSPRQVVSRSGTPSRAAFQEAGRKRSYRWRRISAGWQRTVGCRFPRPVPRRNQAASRVGCCPECVCGCREHPEHSCGDKPWRRCKPCLSPGHQPCRPSRLFRNGPMQEPRRYLGCAFRRVGRRL